MKVSPVSLPRALLLVGQAPALHHATMVTVAGVGTHAENQPALSTVCRCLTRPENCMVWTLAVSVINFTAHLSLLEQCSNSQSWTPRRTWKWSWISTCHHRWTSLPHRRRANSQYIWTSRFQLICQRCQLICQRRRLICQKRQLICQRRQWQLSDKFEKVITTASICSSITLNLQFSRIQTGVLGFWGFGVLGTV